MNLLKQNLFLVVTVLVLLIASGLVLAWHNSEADRGSGYAERRAKLAKDIVRQANKPANEKVVLAAEENVATLRRYHAQIRDGFLARSRAAYPPMQFTAADTGAEATNAFPVSGELYERRGMGLVFPARYRTYLDVMLTRIEATVPPTAQEIAEEEKRMRAKESDVGRPGGIRRPGASPDAIGPEDPYGRPYIPPRGGAPTPPGVAPKVEKTLAQRARERLVVAKANAGHVFAARTVLDELLPADIEYSHDKLWMAQVGLWVQGDILEAIKATNDSYRSREEGKDLPGVQNSAVKRLVDIHIRGYACGSAPGAGMNIPPAGRPDVGRPEFGGPEENYGRPMFDRLQGGGGGAAGRITYVGGSTRSAMGGARGTPRSSTAPKLTGRTTSILYDTIHYEFVVDISSADLLRLYDNLLRRNYHTILDVSIGKANRTGQPVAGAGPGRGGRGGPGAGGQPLYDYGSASVVRATLVGELLIMADWTRGRWDKKTNAWDPDFPALMPVEFLQRLKRADMNALRPEDLKRVPQLR